jgi:hypothetical protein
MQFIQINEGGIQVLAERDGNTYCRWEQDRDGMTRLADAKTKTSTASYERYRPINTQNADTIELRFFAGLSDPAFMKRSLQFVHSLVEFTRVGNFKSDRSWEAYTRYVRRYAMRYRELASFMNKNERKLLVSAVASEYKYTDTIMPDLKAKRKAMHEQDRIAARNERERITRNENLGNTNGGEDCVCQYCIIDREEAARLNPTEVVPTPEPEPIPDNWYNVLNDYDDISIRNDLMRQHPTVSYRVWTTPIHDQAAATVQHVEQLVAVQVTTA